LPGYSATFNIVAWAIIWLFICLPRSVRAQAFHTIEPAMLEPIQLAQAPTIPSLTPTDITPIGIIRERELLKPGMTYYLFKKLPSRFWFNLSAETSQRYESNVFFSKTNYRSDYVFRETPNITAGYELFKKINIYANYFVIKDVFVGHNQLTFPTTQSLALGFRRDFTLNERTNLQLDFQSRELWQSTHLHQADLIPGFTLTRFLSPRSVLFSNILLQMRGANYFVAPTREIDPFYTLGFLHTKGAWMFSTVGTLVTNFRHPPFNDSIPPVSNNSIVADFEVSHPIPKMPYLVAFIRAEPIWNWSSHGYPGISGFDFRLFSGIRLTLAKPALHSDIENLRQQLKELHPDQTGHMPESSSQTSPESSSQPSSEVSSGNASETPNKGWSELDQAGEKIIDK